MFTIAILAQGIHRAAAPAQAFGMPGFDPCRAQMIVAPRRGEGWLEHGPDTTRREATKLASVAQESRLDDDCRAPDAGGSHHLEHRAPASKRS